MVAQELVVCETARFLIPFYVIQLFDYLIWRALIVISAYRDQGNRVEFDEVRGEPPWSAGTTA